MRKRLIAAAVLFGLAASPAMAAVEVGKPVPDFSVPDIEGKVQTLSQYRGAPVVLEWSNPECPFVKKFYEPGAMQELQKHAAGKGVVWLKINSSAEGKQGNLTAEQAKESLAKTGSSVTSYILDGKGEIGKQFSAKTTPHMFVIDNKGVLAYAGAIDDKPTASQDDIKGAKNYVRAAIDALTAGKPVEVASSDPYGCSVKY